MHSPGVYTSLRELDHTIRHQMIRPLAVVSPIPGPRLFPPLNTHIRCCCSFGGPVLHVTGMVKWIYHLAKSDCSELFSRNPSNPCTQNVRFFLVPTYFNYYSACRPSRASVTTSSSSSLCLHPTTLASRKVKHKRNRRRDPTQIDSICHHWFPNKLAFVVLCDLIKRKANRAFRCYFWLYWIWTISKPGLSSFTLARVWPWKVSKDLIRVYNKLHSVREPNF